MNLPDDDKLIQFLKEHEPCPPPAQEGHEALLFALLDGQAQPTKRWRKSGVIWLFPTAIAAGLVVMFGQYQRRLPTPEFATTPAASVKPTARVEDQELEAFLEDSWSNSLDKNLYNAENPSGYGSFIANPEP